MGGSVYYIKVGVLLPFFGISVVFSLVLLLLSELQEKHSSERSTTHFLLAYLLPVPQFPLSNEGWPVLFSVQHLIPYY